MIGALVWYSRRKKKRSKAWPAVEGRNPETNAGPNPSDLVRGQLFRSQLFRGRWRRWGGRRRFLGSGRCRGRRLGRGRFDRWRDLAHRPDFGFADFDSGHRVDWLTSLSDRLREVPADDAFHELANRLLRRDVGDELRHDRPDDALLRCLDAAVRDRHRLDADVPVVLRDDVDSQVGPRPLAAREPPDIVRRHVMPDEL